VKRRLFIAVAEIALIAAVPSYAAVAARGPEDGQTTAALSSENALDNPDLPIATAPPEYGASTAPPAPPRAAAISPATAPSPAASEDAPPPAPGPSIEALLDSPPTPAAAPTIERSDPPSVQSFARAAAYQPDSEPSPAPAQVAQPAPQSLSPAQSQPVAKGGDAAEPSAWAQGDASQLKLAQVTVRLPGAPPAAPPPTGLPPSGPPAPASGAPPTVTTEPPMGPYGRPHINPYQRDIDMTVPLMYHDQPLGDLPVRITFDDQFFVQTDGFLKLINPKLNSTAQAALAKSLGLKQMFTGNDLVGTGVQLEYDPSSLSIVVLSIDPAKRAVERLFDQPRKDQEPPDLKAARFSGYMNLSLNEAVYESGGATALPTVGVNGAVRLQNFVLEYDGLLTEISNTTGATENYGFQRNYVRLVYDQPDSYTRWFLGDLSPEIRGDQSFVEMGGIGVLRSRQTFNDYETAVLQTNRQLLLQSDSDVTIMRNGTVYQQLHLRAGSYDLSALPLLAGGNDVQIEVRDATGQTQQLNFQSYLDPIDLQPGDYEYGAYLGPVSRTFGNSPNYDGPIAFTGFYRKALVNAPAFGIGVQLADDVQDVTGQTQFLLPHAARILLDAGFSHSRTDGGGFAFGGAYEQSFNRSGLVDSLTVRADYLSDHFAGLADPSIDNTDALTVDGQYSRSISQKLTLTADISFTKERGGTGDQYRADLDLNYAISKHWTVRAGVDYAHFNIPNALGHGFGGLLSLVWQPNYLTRAEARYDSTIDSESLSLTKASPNLINSLGYGALLERDSGQLTLSGFADYTSNRFDAAIAQSSGSVNGLGGFGTQNVTSFTLDTSIAFADGVWGVGRRIPDSFALVYPHPSLEGHQVLAGQTLEGNNYIGESGALGAAVNNALVDYTTQSVQYNVVNPPIGYDVGPGVERVHPPYRSGYKIEVGTDAFVTAIGTLIGSGGKPISLVGGRVVAIGRPDLEPLPFFTNSIGRFGLLGLRPSLHYRVEIYQDNKVVPAFEFTVPKDTKGLLELKAVPMQKSN
jgi:outer membrane usher protein